MGNLIKGIDISRWQGTDINWRQVKANGYLFSFIKSTDGSAYKKQFIEMGIDQANDAENVGLKIGYYHFAHPSNFGGLNRDAEDESNFFLKTLTNFPKPNFPLILDLEDEKMNLTPSETEEWVKIFRNNIRDSGFDLIMYSYKKYLDRVLPSNHKFGKMPLWLASYPKTFDINAYPKNPVGWNSWEIWQYSEKGNVQGINGNSTDLNLMRKEFFDLY